ncbi:MAG: peptidylprolyl isomerase [Candidatus Didemnitutus sp.]|nr:peptidylprolyl isomerase [Candidatus Didemnitutus sp.]
MALTSLAQSTNPALTQTLPTPALTPSGSAITLDLADYFGLPTVGTQVVQFDTVMGKFNVELLANAAPLSVANFLGYVSRGNYTNTFFHRSVPGFVIQGGGFYSTLPVDSVPTVSPISLEYNLPNTRGTIAMARTGELNSATSQWFINTVDNTTSLGQANGGGYAVFGRVLGSGMVIADAIAALPWYNLGGVFSELPLRNVAQGQTQVLVSNFVTVNTISVVPIYPSAGGGTSVLTLAVQQNTAPAVVTASISGRTLTLTPGSTTGLANITLTATDTNANVASGVLQVKVANSQSLTFAALSDRPFSATPITLGATASSGLSVSYSVESGPGQISGNTLTLTGVGTVVIRASQLGDGTYHAAPAVERSFVSLPSFHSWREQYFTAGELADPQQSGPLAIRTADGLTNLLKYALGLDPKVEANAGLPATAATANDWTYIYTRPVDRADLTYTVEVSSDLVNWTSNGVAHEAVASDAGIATWRASVPRGSAVQFFRLKVTAP